jgi:threonine aldolase
LQDDHVNARRLAEGLAEIEGLFVALEAVQTNMVYVDVVAGPERAARLIVQLEELGIRAWNLGARLRFVTSMLVDEADCIRATEACAVAMVEQ